MIKNLTKIVWIIFYITIIECSITGISYMDPLNPRTLPDKNKEDPCNPLYWYPKAIPERCFLKSTLKPPITKTPNGIVPVPIPVPIPHFPANIPNFPGPIPSFPVAIPDLPSFPGPIPNFPPPFPTLNDPMPNFPPAIPSFPDREANFPPPPPIPPLPPSVPPLPSVPYSKPQQVSSPSIYQQQIPGMPLVPQMPLIPAQVPFGVPLYPTNPMLPVPGIPYPPFNPYHYPSHQLGFVPGIKGLVSDDGGINILPFSDAYSDLLEKHKNKILRRKLHKLLGGYSRYPSRRRYYRRRFQR